MAVSETLTLTTRASKGTLRDAAFRMTSEEMDTNLTNIKSLVEAIAVQSNTNEDDITTLNGVVATKPNVTTITNLDSPYDATWGEFIKCDCSSGAITINFPTAVGNEGQVIDVIKIDASVNEPTIDGNGAQTINGDPTLSINQQWECWTVMSDGSNLLIRSKSA